MSRDPATTDPDSAPSDGSGQRQAEEVSDRFRRVSVGFTERVDAVPPGHWEAPAPCEGWVARDVVRHVVEWFPAFFLTIWEVPQPVVPSVDDDPAGAWAAVRDAIQDALDDPEVLARERDTPLGSSFASAISTGAIPDVLVHTWDLARAAGLDETLDADEISRLVASIEEMPFEAMESSGHYRARVPAAADADDQTRVLNAFGRRP